MSKIVEIPEGWETVKLDEVAKLYKGKGIAKNELSDTGVQCIRYGELYTTYGAVIYSVLSKTFISENDLFLSYKNDVLIPSSGETAIDIATASCILEDGVAIGGDINIIRTSINGEFLSYYINTIAKNTIAAMAQGSSVIHLYPNKLRKLHVIIPKSKKEQEKIAEILSEVDGAIKQAKALHVKQQKIKTALMQDLLSHGIDESGAVRSPQTHSYKPSPLGDIPVEWDIKELRELGECKNGLTYSPKDVREIDGILVLRSSNIVENKISFNDKVYVRKSMNINYQLQKGDILICVRNGSRRLIGKSALIPFEAEGMAHGAFMTVFHTENFKYVFHLIQSDMFFKQVNINLGATINSINNSDLELFSFPIPKSKIEQQKISEILSLQDEKIEQSKSKFEKLQSIKTALMQDLLSGKKRVNHLLKEEA